MSTRGTPQPNDWQDVGDWQDVSESKQKVPQAVLNALKAKSSQPTQFERNAAQRTGVLPFVGDLAKKGVQLFGGAAQMASQVGTGNPAPVVEAGYESYQAAKEAGQQYDRTVKPDDAGQAYEQLRASGVLGFLPSERTAWQVSAALGGDPQQSAEAFARGDTLGGLKGQNALIAQAAAPEVAKRLAPVPIQVRDAMRGRVIANPDPGMNLAAAATKGGLPGQGVSVTDIASPELVKAFRETHAEAVAQNPARGAMTPENFKATAQDTVAKIDGQLQRELAPVQNRSLGGVQNSIAAELDKMANSTAIESRGNALRSWAEKIRGAKTYGDLLRIKSDAFADASKASLGEISADAGGSAGYDVGSSILRNAYPEISKAIGKDIGPLGNLERQAIQLQTQAEKAFPKMEAIDVQHQTATFLNRFNPANLLRPKTAAASMGAGAMTPAELRAFINNYKAAVKGATPGAPPVQGPAQPLPGKYNTGGNPLGPPNPGEGPINPPSAQGPNSPVRPMDRPNPGRGGISPAGSTTPMPSEGQPLQSPFGKPNALADALQKHGGHAGNTVASIEELNRPGIHGTLGKGGDFTYHGKSFAPENTPQGGAHVTIFDDGTYRVNSGTLSEGQQARLQAVIREIIKRKK